MSQTEQILASMPGDVLNRLRRADELWRSLREGSAPVPRVVTQSREPLGDGDYDVVICGGTLGILLGAVLQRRGWRVALVERGILRGRDQEWNISRRELSVFLELELLSQGELEDAIATQYNPARINFFKGPEFWIQDVLNIGVDPVFLLDTLKAKFLAAGGQLFEKTAFEGAVVHPDGVLLELKVSRLKVEGSNESSDLQLINLPPATQMKARLLIDAMGNFSPIVAQARQGKNRKGYASLSGVARKAFPKMKRATSSSPLHRS